MANILKYDSEIKTGFIIQPWHISQSVDAFTGVEEYDITISGSLTTTGSIQQVGEDSYFLSNIGIGTTNISERLNIQGKININDGGNSVFIGENSGINDNQTDNRNVALGYAALRKNTFGSSNVAIGFQTLRENTVGFQNTALGYLSLSKNTTGSQNVGIGYQSLLNNTSGIRNVANGKLSLQENTTGEHNTAVGYSSFSSNTTGNFNVSAGFFAGTFTSTNGDNQTGDNSVFLGSNTKANADGETNQIVIGYNAIGKGSNTITLGSDDITDTYLKGAVRIEANGDSNPTILRNSDLQTTSVAGHNTFGFNSNDNFYFRGSNNKTAILSFADNSSKHYIFPSGGPQFDTIALKELDNNFGVDQTIHGINFGRGGNSISSNIAIGQGALESTNAGFNLAIGIDAGKSLTTGQRNTLLGYEAGFDITTGNSNTIIGSIFGNQGLSNTVIIAAGQTEKFRIDDTNNTILQGDLTVPQGIYANGSLGNSGDLLTSTGTGIQWISGSDVFVTNQQLGNYQLLSEKGQALGYTPLNSNSKIEEQYLPDSILGQVTYQGTWNANTNTPTLPDPPPSTTKGEYYVTDVGGTQFGIDFQVGDWIISNGVEWQKVDNTDAVTSVFGRLGNIQALASDYDAFYDNYQGWTLFTNGTSRGSITSGENINFVGGTNVSLGYSSTNNTITVNSTDTNDIDYISNVTLTGNILDFTGVGNAFGGSVDLSQFIDNTNTFLTDLSFNMGNGVLTATLNNGSTITEDLDGRYALDSSIGNGTLTLNTSGIAIGAGSFSANQSSNSTFTVDVPGTNLTMGGSGNNRTVNSSTGNNVLIPIASTTDAGFLSTEDKNKLAGIESGAEVNTVNSVNAQTGNVDLDADDINDSTTTNKFTSQADIDRLANTSGTNTGDQDLSNYVDRTTNQTVGGEKYFTDNVGIGTTSPGSKLEISQNAPTIVGESTQLQRIRSNTSNSIYLNTSTIRHTDGTDWSGIKFRIQHQVDTTPMAFIDFNPSLQGQNLSFGTSNVERLRIQNNGDVGIGTPSPGEKLEVNGNIQFQNNNYIKSKSSNNNITRIHGINSSNVEFIGSVDQTVGSTVIGNNTNTINLRTLNSTRMSINSSGRVGIGTSVPDGKFSVRSGGDFSNKNDFLATFKTYANVNGQTGDEGGLFVQAGFDRGADIVRFSSIGLDFIDVPRFVVKDDGNVGIGTPSPSEKLEVNGNIKATGFIGGGSQLQNLDYNNISNPPPIPTVNNNTIAISAGGALTGGGSFTLNQNSNQTITINHQDTSTQGSVDNVFGTVIQDISLDTYGHITNINSINLDGRYYTEIESDARYLKSFTSDTMNGSLTADAFIESSLRKYKQNIQTFSLSGLELVNNLNIVTFDKIDGPKDKIGIIADDSDKSFLNEEKNAVDLYKTLFIQAKAIQELTKRVESLEKKIDNG